MNQETYKRCPHCKQMKPISAFNKNRTTKDGLQSLCRECHAIYFKNRTRKSPQREGKGTIGFNWIVNRIKNVFSRPSPIQTESMEWPKRIEVRRSTINEVRESVLKASNFRCDWCGITEARNLGKFGQRLIVCHYDGKRMRSNSKAEELIVLCCGCHGLRTNLLRSAKKNSIGNQDGIAA